ncbi:hypothetical protein WT27_05410 [Burkholderia territorii]|uniref:Uncharacterized protein n=1 Tax=Burkholderia territorii TaxID=1503055 RepID=A0A106EHS9_9BURK|nr:hypothetical protein WT27_05410 [Burkholderia territorii]KVX48033.1 hypothetical protein WT31_20275 [Burkholderia territorii]
MTSINADASASRNPRIEPGIEGDSGTHSADRRANAHAGPPRSAVGRRARFAANRTIDSNAARVTAAPP